MRLDVDNLVDDGYVGLRQAVGLKRPGSGREKRCAGSGGLASPCRVRGIYNNWTTALKRARPSWFGVVAICMKISWRDHMRSAGYAGWDQSIHVAPAHDELHVRFDLGKSRTNAAAALGVSLHDAEQSLLQ